VVAAHTLLVFLGAGAPNVAKATLVGTGDIAFIRFNADGTDDLGIVLLADADMGQQIHFNDNVYSAQFNAFGTGEDAFTWNVTESLAAGTVVTFSNLSDPFGPGVASHGTITGNPTNTMRLSQDGETVYAFLGANNRNPSTFLAAVSTENSSVLNGTGLADGDTARVLPGAIDEAHYTGARNTESTFPGYRALIGNLEANWDIRPTDTGTIDPPFSTTNFMVGGVTNVPESPAVIWVGLLCLLSWYCLVRGRMPTAVID
jgi:hypothetical protein